MCLSLCPHKALALQEYMECGVSHMWPLTVLQIRQHALFAVDEDATQELQIENVQAEHILDVELASISIDPLQYLKSAEKIAAELDFEQMSPSRACSGAKGAAIIKWLSWSIDTKPKQSLLFAPPELPDAMASRLRTVSKRA